MPSNAKVAVYRGKNYWSMKIRIPVSVGNVDLRGGITGIMPIQDAPWRINVCRQRVSDGKRFAYSLSGSTFHDKINFAKFFIENGK